MLAPILPPTSRPLRPRIAVLSLAALAACSPTISTFNATAYEQATSLKVESRTLMEKATEPYAAHADAVRRLKMKLRKAYEFARGRPKNKISARQWKILISPDRDLLGGFLRNWKEQGSFSQTFVDEKKAQVSKAFDTIIQLESGKMKPEEVRDRS